jgi:hypothetical protein
MEAGGQILDPDWTDASAGAAYDVGNAATETVPEVFGPAAKSILSILIKR